MKPNTNFLTLVDGFLIHVSLKGIAVQHARIPFAVKQNINLLYIITQRLHLPASIPWPDSVKLSLGFGRAHRLRYILRRINAPENRCLSVLHQLSALRSKRSIRFSKALTLNSIQSGPASTLRDFRYSYKNLLSNVNKVLI